MNWDTRKFKQREMDNEKKDSDSVLIHQVVYVCALIVGVILSLMLVGVCGILLWGIVVAAWTVLQDIGWDVVWTEVFHRVVLVVVIVLLISGPFIVEWAWKRLKSK